MKVEVIVALIGAISAVIAALVGAIATYLSRPKEKEEKANNKKYSTDDIVNILILQQKELIATLLQQKEINVGERKNQNESENFNEEYDRHVMTIFNENGEKEEVEIIVAFEFKDNNKEYVVYTKNEHDKYDNVTVYVSEVDRTSGEPKLFGVDDEKEWERVKSVLIELSREERESYDYPKYDKDGIEIL